MLFRFLCIILFLLLSCGCGTPSEYNYRGESPVQPIRVTVAPSLVDSGLSDVLVNMFESQTPYKITIIPANTGQALTMAENGSVDAIIVNYPEAIEGLLKRGKLTKVHQLFHNDFFLVGPSEDPAKVLLAKNFDGALHKIASTGSLFVSRGDGSGSNRYEVFYWDTAGVDPRGKQWYLEADTSAALLLNLASQRKAYSIVDEATYYTLRTQVKSKVFVKGDAAIVNSYVIGLVHQPDSSKAKAIRAFEEFMLGANVHKLIRRYGVQELGQMLYVSDIEKNRSLRHGFI